jgi:putative transcriptional regulator
LLIDAEARQQGLQNRKTAGFPVPTIASPDYPGDKRRAARVVRVKPVDVTAVRRKTGLSQQQFATMFGVPLDTLCKWEQRTRTPAGASRLLMHVIEREPQRIIKIARTVQQVESRKSARSGG